MIKLDKVLVPTDFSDYSKCAITYGCALAARFDSELHLLNVVQDPAVYVPEPTLIAMEAVEEQIKQLHDDAMKSLATLPKDDLVTNKPIVREVLHGAPFVEIVRYAREKDIDLIVIGTHGRSGLKHVLLGSVAERVVRKAPCPVLTVRPDAHHFVMP